MIASDINPVELKVFLNHIYELKKGVRQMVLYTTKRKYEDFAVKRLINQKINYIIQPVGNDKINLFFGRKECINAIRFLVNQPLNKLSPEQDFILGAMLGYDICVQCKRYLNVVVKGCLNNFQASFFTFYVNHLFIYFVALLA